MNDFNAKFYENGQGLVEYTLIFVLFVGTLLLSLSLLGISVQQAYCGAIEGLGNTTACGCSFAFNDQGDLEDWTANEKNADQFYVENGKGCIDGKSKGNASFMNSCSSDFGNDDVVLSMKDLNSEEAYQSNQNNGYDVWFRAQDDRNGYHFTYTSKHDRIRFWKRVNGKWIMLSQAKASDVDWQGNTYDLDIKVVGDTFTAYKDGVPVLQANDKGYQEGAVGLRTKADSKTCIDDFSVGRP
jgi:hypothetical protein